MKPVRIGVAGTGAIFYGWGEGSGHLPALAWLAGEAQVCALFSRDSGRVQRAHRALMETFERQAKTFEQQGDGGKDLFRQKGYQKKLQLS